MAIAKMVEYDEAAPDVRAVYDDIMQTKGIDWVPNFWKTLGSHAPLLRDVWHGLKETMQPGRLDSLTKELIAIAVSVTNSCEYCINSHTAAARKLGADDALLGELMAVIGTFNRTNKLADGYQVEVDAAIYKAARRPPETAEPA
jgi:AhpD family alkylhydroperoxidase